MKKTIFSILMVVFSYGLYAGGIITNTNQSARSVRMQAVDATISTEGVYFNPAGLTLLPNNGLFLSINNQSLFQTRTVKSYYASLNNDTYEGKITAPLFPGIYAAYKLDKLVFSLGFNPIGGGGGGKYDNGLPSFEYPIADLKQITGATNYRMDAYFEGQSVYFGLQGNFSYQINDMISVAVGARYIMAKESYNGYLKDIDLYYNNSWESATSIFMDLANQATVGALATSGAATSMQPLIDGGAGGLTFAQAEGGGAIDAVQRAQLEGGLLALGIPQAQIDGMTLAVAQQTYLGASQTLSESAIEAGGAAEILKDQEADYEKTAAGITPIFSVNIKPSDKLNIALKYEMNTKLEFTNKTTKNFTTGFDPVTGDPVTMFPDGEKSRLDIPAQMVVGGSYQVMDQLLVAAGFHYYFDKQADWNGREDEVDAGLWEANLGFEYSLSDNLKTSIGYLRTQAGVKESYQNDLSQALPSNSISGGFGYQINPMIGIDIGVQYSAYEEGSKTFVYEAPAGSLNIKETYTKPILIFAIGAHFNFNTSK